MAIVAPPVTDIALTIEPAVTDVEDIAVIVLLFNVTVVPKDEPIAVTKFPVLDNVPMVLLEMTFVGEAEVLLIPVTAPVVEDNPVIVFVLVLLVIVLAGCAFTIPTKAPPAPEEIRVVMLLLLTFNVVAEPLLPILKAVIVLVEVIPKMLLVETDDVAPPKKFAVKAVTTPEPKAHVLNVFPVMVFVGLGVTPSVLDHPVMVVVPDTVILEKLLLLLLITAPATEPAVSV